MTTTQIIIIVAVVGVALVDLDRNSTPIFVSIVGLIATSVPALIAAAFAERSSHDIRNGVVEEKAKRGTHKALEEAGVTEVVEATQRGEGSVAALRALTALLEERSNPSTTHREK